jgi:hypothetical protein
MHQNITLGLFKQQLSLTLYSCVMPDLNTCRKTIWINFFPATFFQRQYQWLSQVLRSFTTHFQLVPDCNQTF